MTRIYCKKGSKQVWKDIKVCRENCKRKCQNFKEKEEKLREEMEAINPLTGKKVMFCNRTTGQAHIH